MKTSLFSTLSAALVLVLTLGALQTCQAQSFHVDFGDQFSGRSSRTGGAYIDDYGNLVIVSPGRNRPIQPSFNPVIDRQESGEFKYDPRTGRWELKNTTDTIHASALDRNRGLVDPGSLRSTSNVARDAQGNVIETTVTSWTSRGVPHSNTTTRRIQQGNNGRVIDERNVMRSTGPGANGPAPQADDKIPGFDD